MKNQVLWMGYKYGVKLCWDDIAKGRALPTPGVCSRLGGTKLYPLNKIMKEFLKMWFKIRVKSI